MTRATQDDDFTKILRDFMQRTRDRIGKRMGDLPPHAIERALDALIAGAAAILLLLSGGKPRDGIIGALLAAAAGFLARRATADVQAPTEGVK